MFDSGLRARHIAIGLFGAVVGVVVVVSSIGRLAGFADIRDALSGATGWWLVFCAVGQLLVFAGYAGMLRRAIGTDGGPQLPVGVAVRLALASFAATQLFAFAGAAGLAVVYWALRRVGRGRSDATVVLIGLNTCVYLVFAVIAWLAAGAALVADRAPVAMTLPWLIGVPMLFVAARWFTAPTRVGRWTADFSGTLRRALATGVAAAAWTRDRVAQGDGLALLGWAACYWAGDVVSLWAALRAFGAAPEPAPLVAAYTTGYIVQALPIPLIATAGVDAATTFLLHLVGVPLEIALLAVVAHRVFAFWLPILPGCLFAFTLLRGDTLDRRAGSADVVRPRFRSRARPGGPPARGLPGRT
jgi:uncharacterized membrane protein YbhN (UPF0104 family)